MDEEAVGPEVGKGARAEGARALSRYLYDEMRTGRLRAGVKLPPERELSLRFGASRGAVRRVLSEFRERGLITQAVGSGTFVSEEVEALSKSSPASPLDTAISPAELMEARRLIEPLMPAIIARNATVADFAAMDACNAQAEAAQSIEDFEYWDGELHRTLAIATHNAFFLQILELINRAREQAEWGRLKRNSLTPQRRAEYERQHRALVAALRDRDADKAAALLTAHLDQIRLNLFGQ